MICGRTLFFGPFIALSLLSGIARSADDSALGLASTPQETVDRPTRRPVVEISDDAAANWRRSHNETATGVRFIKPSIPGRAHAAAPARAHATNGERLIQSVQPDRWRDSAAAQNVSIKRVEVKSRVAADKMPAEVPANVSGASVARAEPPRTDPQLAGATAAKLRQLIEQPKPQLSAAVQPPRQEAAEGDSAAAELCATNEPMQSEAPADVFITDESNQFADKQVVQASTSAPRQFWAAGTRLLQGIGQIFPITGSRSDVAQ